jgi:hypothetical protein
VAPYPFPQVAVEPINPFPGNCMSDYQLNSWGSSDCSRLDAFDPAGPFFIAVEFDLKRRGAEGLVGFYFFLCNEEGFGHQTRGHDPQAFKHTIVIEKYAYDFVLNHLETVVKPKIEALDNVALFAFLDDHYYRDE